MYIYAYLLNIIPPPRTFFVRGFFKIHDHGRHVRTKVWPQMNLGFDVGSGDQQKKSWKTDIYRIGLEKMDTVDGRTPAPPNMYHQPCYFRGYSHYSPYQLVIAGFLNHQQYVLNFEDVFPIEDGDIPASFQVTWSTWVFKVGGKDWQGRMWKKYLVSETTGFEMDGSLVISNHFLCKELESSSNW